MPAFERKIRTQYVDIFREPTGLPPARKDNGFRMHPIPGAELPHRSPYRLSRGEWEVDKEKTQALLTKLLNKKSNSPYAALVIFVPQGIDDEGKPQIHMFTGYKALYQITFENSFLLTHPEDLTPSYMG